SASLLIRCDHDELPRVGTWLESWAREHSVSDETAQHLDLCAAEAVTNVMEYGLTGPTAEIELRIGRQGNDVVFEIEDRGIEFDPTTADLPPPVTMNNDRIGGWGIRIVRRLSDEVRYARINGRNRLTLVFRPRPSAAA